MNGKLEELLHSLKSKHIEFRLIELNRRAVSVNDVIRFSKEDIKREEICKTMIIKAGGKYVGIFLEGDKRIDFGKLKRLFGTDVRLASLEEVRSVAGVDPGAVCPLSLDIPIVIDNKVLGLGKVNFGSGDHLYGIEMKPEDILKLKDAKIAEVSGN